jgi:hypothetical protein
MFCPDDAEIFASTRRPHGNGGAFGTMRHTVDPAQTRALTLEQIARDAYEHATYMSDLGGSISSSYTKTISPTTARDRREVRGLARDVVKLMDTARDAQAERMQKWQENLRAVSQTSVNEVSKWANFVTATTRKLVNARADINLWAQTYLGENDRANVNNSTRMAFELMEPKIQGTLQKFTKAIEEVNEQLKPIAQRTGYTVDEVATIFGDYANCQMMPEINQLLLDRWQGEIAAERLRNRGDESKVRIAQLQHKIENLSANLNNPNPKRDLISGGYTNAEAQQLQQRILDMGFTKEEIEAWTADFRERGYRGILEARVQAGLVSPEVLRSFPDFQYHLPVKTKFDNITGAVNDAALYSPGTYGEIKGRINKPDSAYFTVLNYARRAANEIGMQDFTLRMAAAAKDAEVSGKNNGLLMFNVAQLKQWKMNGEPQIRRWAENLEERGCLIADIPSQFDPQTGEPIGSTKMLVTFDPNWKDPKTGLTGMQLNDALVAAPKHATSFGKGVARWTSRTGQLFTRFRPTFAFINCGRDLMMRSTGMLARDYYRPDGTMIVGSSLVSNYLTNTPRAARMLMDTLVRDTAAPDSDARRLWNEYVSAGLHQQYTRGQNEIRRTLADVIEARDNPTGFVRKYLTNPKDPKGKKFAEMLNGLGDRKDQALAVLDGWNDYFNNIASFNQFVTLRDAGLSVDSAAHATLEMMNLYQRGTATPALQCLYPFIIPTMQGAANIMRTMGFVPDQRGVYRATRKGMLTVAGLAGAYSMLLPIMKDSMGTDENGNSYFDAMSLSELQRGIPIGLGDGDYIKLPLDYGIPQIVATMMVGADRVERGLMAPADYGFEMVYTLVKNMSPGNWPEFSMTENPMAFFTQAFMPQLLSPFAESVTNTGWAGQKLTWAERGGTKAMADQGSSSTPKFYHDAAKYLYRNMHGPDLAPEQIQSIIEGFATGPFRFIKGWLEGDTPRKHGAQPPASERMGEFLSTLGGTMLFGTVNNASQRLFYRALDAYQAELRRAGVKMTDTSYKNDPDKRMDYQRAQLESIGWDEDKIQDWFVLDAALRARKRADSEMGKRTKAIWLNSDDSEELRSAFDELANQTSSIYDEAVANLNFYAGAR